MLQLPLVTVTNREKAVVTTVKNTLQNLTLLYCWNHFMKGIERWSLLQAESESFMRT